MKIYDWLENAALENKSSDYSAGVKGRIWWNSTSDKIMTDDGTNIRALLRNDGKAIVGNSGTASQNIRLHRGASGVLQFVSGADTTSEGSLSTALNQISAKLENYTTAGLPANGNAGRTVWDTTTSQLKTDDGATWVTVGPGSPQTAPYEALNYTLTFSVAASALTINLKNQAGNDPSSGDPVKFSFRSATATAGTYSQLSITSALSLTISSGSTLGHRDAAECFIYVYIFNDAGTARLGVSGSYFDESVVQSSTAEGGAGAADSASVIYTGTAVSSKAVRLIAKLKSTQTTAGTWAAVPTSASLLPFPAVSRSEVQLYGGEGHGSTNTKIRRFTTVQSRTGNSIGITQSATDGDSFTIQEDGLYSITYWDYRGGADGEFGLSKNSAALTTNISSLPIGTILCMGGSFNTGGGNNFAGCVSITHYFVVGDVIRAHTSGNMTTNSGSVVIGIRITRVGN